VNHFEIEEQDLFRTVESNLGKVPLIAELIADHRALEAMVNQMRGGATPEVLLRFTTLLRAHIRREESELFEDIQKRLPRSALNALGESISAKAVRICL
ncbi:MAG: hemerythrin domain-containing protein, partial [Bryobacteraceae bacterium]